MVVLAAAVLVLSGCTSKEAATAMLDTVRQYVDAYYGSEYEKALELTSGDAYTALKRKIELLKDMKWKIYDMDIKVLYTNRDGTRGTVKCTVTWGDETTENRYVGQHKYVFDLMKLDDGWKIYNAPTITGPTEFDF